MFFSCKSQFKYKVMVKGSRIKNAVISQDLMVDIYAILGAINFVKLDFEA